MNDNLKLAYDILFPRVIFSLLKGLCDAHFNEEKNKFFAFTYIKIDKEEYQEVSFYLNNLGHGSYADYERQKIYLTPNTFQIKDTAQCVEEGIYSSYAISFTGVIYENEWYVSESLTYFGDEFNEASAKNILLFHGHPLNEIWEGGMFVP